MFAIILQPTIPVSQGHGIICRISQVHAIASEQSRVLQSILKCWNETTCNLLQRDSSPQAKVAEFLLAVRRLLSPVPSILPAPSAKSKYFHKSMETMDRYQEGR